MKDRDKQEGCIQTELSHLCPFWSFTIFPDGHLGGVLTPSTILYGKVQRSISQQKIQEDSSSLWSTHCWRVQCLCGSAMRERGLPLFPRYFILGSLEADPEIRTWGKVLYLGGTGTTSMEGRKAGRQGGKDSN